MFKNLLITSAIWLIALVFMMGLVRVFPAESAKASYYSYEFGGRKTANGEPYYPHQLTAAHKTLPFGTIVKVTNVENGKSVIVRINDRGPYIKGRTIDLSYGAAEQIDMLHDGVADVEMVILAGGGYVQAALQNSG